MSNKRSNRVFAGIALLLFAAGWAANHFATALVLIQERLGVSSVLLNGAFGIYALGLLPCLLLGGNFADRFGARYIVLAGGVLSGLGNLSLLFFHEGAALLIGRFLVGIGVGLVVSAGTAWAGMVRGGGGVTLAGIILTLGFAVGPIIASAFGVATGSIVLVFLLSVALSVLSVGLGWLGGDVPRVQLEVDDGYEGPKVKRSLGKALAVSLPMAIWVFSCVTTSLIILSARASEHFPNGVALPGIASTLAFGAGLISQYLGRKLNWGRASGTAGALFAMAGFTLAAAGGATVSVWTFIFASLLLGTAYGLCLREGLMGINKYAPIRSHGTAIGIYYVFTYLGFALPVVLDVTESTLGASSLLWFLAALALGSAVLRTVQIKRGYLV